MTSKAEKTHLAYNLTINDSTLTVKAKKKSPRFALIRKCNHEIGYTLSVVSHHKSKDEVKTEMKRWGKSAELYVGNLVKS